MSGDRPTYDEPLDLIAGRQRRIEAPTAEVARPRAELDQARRAGQRQAAPSRKRPPQPDPKRPGRKTGDRHGRHGHRPPPPSDRIDEAHGAVLPDACPHCSGRLVEAGLDQQYQAEIPRRPIRRQFNIRAGRCRQCGGRVQGRHPLQTPDARAAVADLNKRAGLSHGKVAGVMGAPFGIGLTRGASSQVVPRAAGRLGPAYREIRGATADAGRLSVGGTGWRVGGQSAWLHVWVGERATCYRVDRRRGADALEGVIGRDWDGVPAHDGFASYDRFTGSLHQQCIAHLLRRAREAPASAARGAVRFPRQVIALFTGAAHLRNGHRAGRVGPAGWASARDGSELRLLPLLGRDRSGANGGVFSRHLLSHFGSWFTFLSGPSVAATNWQAERAVRPAVVDRKVWGGNRTEAGAAAQGILSSVLRTCQQQAKSAVDFVSRTLRAFGNHLIPRPVLLETR